MRNAFILLALLFAFAAEAVEWHVATTGSDANSGTSASTPKLTIQAAIDAAASGDTIHVAAGTYAPIVATGKAVTIVGDAGAERTLIDGQGTKRCADLSLEAVTNTVVAKSVLRGFTLANGHGQVNGKNSSTEYAGGVRGGRLYDCIISNCTSSVYGAGAYEARLVRCRLVNNTAGYGGGGMRCVFVNCLLLRNRAHVGGTNRYWGEGGGAYASTLYHCTLLHNTAGDLGGAAYGSSLYGCVCWANLRVMTFTPAGTSSSELQRCVEEDCHGPVASGAGSVGEASVSGPDPGFVDSEPGFEDPLLGDYRLAATSPCRSRGSLFAVTNADTAADMQTDLLGHVRVQGEGIEPGAFEIQESDTFVALHLNGHGCGAPGGDYLPPGTTREFKVWEEDGRKFLGWTTNGIDILSTEKTWTVRADQPAAYVLTALFCTNFYVATTGLDSYDGMSPDRPWKTLYNHRYYPGETVRVAAGYYRYLADGLTWSNVCVIGAGSSKTFISGQGSQPCIHFGGGVSVAERRTNVFRDLALISGSSKNLNSTQHRKWSAGADGGTFYDCVISNCQSSVDGGGVSDARLVRCLISDNVSKGTYGGGAVRCDLESCLVTRNDAFYGGGLADCTACNCTVVDNEGSSSGQAYGGAYTNSVFYKAGGENVRHVVNATLVACVTNDPGFVSAYCADWRLRAGSRCLDAGLATAVTSETDFAGRPRIVGASVDIGALEGAVEGTFVEAIPNARGALQPGYAVLTGAQEVVFTATTGSHGLLGFSTNGVDVCAPPPELRWTASMGSASVFPIFATNLYADATKGRDSFDGNTPETPVRTLQDVVGRACPGDTVHVGPGVYGAIACGSGVNIISEKGVSETVIDAGSSSRCASLGSGVGTTPPTRLVGFTLRSGWQCRSHSNRPYEFGGGASGGRLERCIVTGCRADYGGGVYQSTAVNCLFVKNYADTGGAAACKSTLVNCTVLDCATDDGYFTSYKRNVAIQGRLANCIVRCGDAPFTNLFVETSVEAVCTNDPKFVAAAFGDYRLRTGSPALEAGVAPDDAGDVDFNGNPRLVGAAPDCGACEGEVAGAVVVRQTGGLGRCDSADRHFVIPPGTSRVFSVEDEHRTVSGWSTNGKDFVFTDPTYEWPASDGDGTLTVKFSSTLYVDSRATPSARCGFSRADPCRTIGEAVALAADGDTVYVAPGTYPPVSSSSPPAIRIIGEGRPSECVIDGGGTNTCIFFSSSPNVKVCSLTLKNGGGSFGGAYYCTLYGCVVTNCTGTYSGGLYNCSATSCLIVGCRKTSYGGDSAYDSTLTHCTMDGSTSSCKLYHSIYPDVPHTYLQLNNSLKPIEAGVVLESVGDWRLRDWAPAIDAGSAAVADTWDRDAVGNPRVIGAAPDIGALEGGVDVRVVRVTANGYGAVSSKGAVLPPSGGSAAFSARVGLRPFLCWTSNGVPVTATSPEIAFADVGDDIWLTANFATNVYVDALNGRDGASGFYPDDALRTLQDGVGIVLLGERVLAAPGTYAPFATTNQSIAILGAGIGRSFIDGGGTSRCVRLSESVSSTMTNVLLRGFTVANGRCELYGDDGRGAGIFGGTAEDCLVSNCWARNDGAGSWGGVRRRCAFIDNEVLYYGGGGSESSCEDCLFAGNRATYGGGCYNGQCVRCRFEGNYAASRGGGVYGKTNSSADYARDSIFIGNRAGEGGGAYGVSCYGCDFLCNTGGVGAAISAGEEYKFDSSTHFANCILWRNVWTDPKITDPERGEMSSSANFPYYFRQKVGYAVQYLNCVQSCCSESGAGTDGVAGDPKFVDPANGDWRLRGDSPCIDSGTGSFVYTKTDFRGNPRIVGARVDIGAYEGATYGLLLSLRAEGHGAVAEERTFVPSGDDVAITAVETLRPCLGWRLDGAELELCGATWHPCLPPTNGESVATAVFSTNVYADASRPDDTGDGLTRATAKRTLAAAQDAAFDDEILWVAPGTYSAGNPASKSLAYLAEGGHTNTFVTGDFAAEGAAVRVEGVTFGPGGTRASGATFSECLFDGVAVSNAVLERCTVWGDAADSVLNRSLVWGEPTPKASGLATADSYVGDPIFADPENGDFRVAVDSPCATNGAAWCGVVRALAAYPGAPEVTPTNGTGFVDSCLVSVVGASPQAKIWLTTNGRTPRLTDANLYAQPFVVSNTVTIRLVQQVGRLRGPYVAVTLTRIRGDLRTGAGNAELVFTTSGDAEWEPVTEGGLPALRSGALGDGQSAVLASTVRDGGVLTFDWKCDLEHDPTGACLWDRLFVTVDGERRAAIDGAGGWTNVTLRIRGSGAHEVRWIVEKDGYDEPDAASSDFGWLRSVGWTARDPLPEPWNPMSSDDVADVLADFADGRLRRHVRDRERYVRFRTWALGVCDRKGLDPDRLAEHPRSWLSFALDQPALLADEIAEDALRIDGIAAGDPLVLNLSLEGLAVGDGAEDAILREVFGLRGSPSLGADAAFTADGLEILQAAPQDGRAALTVRPKGTPGSFFIKAEVLP